MKYMGYSSSNLNGKWTMRIVDKFLNIFSTNIYILKSEFPFLTTEQIKKDVYMFNGSFDEYDIFYFKTKEDIDGYIENVISKYTVIKNLQE